ncbi:MAG: hypothetical protein L3K02_09390 [Thermoplasmata archaeon]|nr:hypothetical protein [Thermoplasmata archaeon]
MPSLRAGDSQPDFRTLGGEGLGTFLYGPDRSSLLHVAYSLAKLSDPNPYWVEIRDAGRSGDTTDPVGRGRIPEDHLYIVLEGDARPQDAEANMALWSIVRSDEPQSVIAQFTDFLRLPLTVQEAVSRSRSDDLRPVFVIANADRVRPYYPTSATDVRPYIDSMVRAGVIPIFAAVGKPGAGRWAFDFVFEVRPDPSGDRRRGTLECERAPPGLSISAGQSVPFESVPGLLEAIGAN